MPFGAVERFDGECVLGFAGELIFPGHFLSEISHQLAGFIGVLEPIEIHVVEQAVMAEVHKHWAKSADGYTSALAEGSSFAPIRFLRQCKDISIHGVLPRTLDDSDKLNGVQFAGTAIFNETPAREAGEAGIAFGGLAGIGLTRAPGRWTGWTGRCR